MAGRLKEDYIDPENIVEINVRRETAGPADYRVHVKKELEDPNLVDFLYLPAEDFEVRKEFGRMIADIRFNFFSKESLKKAIASGDPGIDEFLGRRLRSCETCENEMFYHQNQEEWRCAFCCS